MKKYQAIGIGILATTLALSTGCKEPVPLTEEDKTIENNLQVGLNLGEPQTIEGVITEVMPSAFNYFIGARSGGVGSHDIIWVTIKHEGQPKTLLYPTTGAIRKGNATVTYREVEGGQLNQLEFIKQNSIPEKVNDYDRGAHRKLITQQPPSGRIIPVDGIIDLDGIDYNL
ncbi:hypothetical protein HOK51_04110 [Candidatus Woesearchaeota archaeon]|jgi:hypothetical protein|nr:hypothetical protein [Candidatus Woesearchaeota archaeon]MBT6519006.1 hypothetical protein [Candidatus Woesearchaeota archaeon]MBT7368795.1 hypothetical protein [Candidatus Woesearchaeota archaeon]